MHEGRKLTSFFACDIPPHSQAKRLEELDRLYREEVVSRKRAHNALQVGS